jgi:formate C-acetyltransferase
MSSEKRIENRTLALKDRVLGAPRGVCLERARFYTQAYRELEGEHPSIRAARALEKTLRNMTIYILDEELIVGNKSSELVRALIPIERGDIPKEIKHDSDMWERYNITEEQRRELVEELMPYWEGKTVFDLKADLIRKNNLLACEMTELNLSDIRLPPQVQDLIIRHIEDMDTILHLLSTTTPYAFSNVFDPQGHLVLGHKRVINMGLRGIKEEALKKLEEMEDREKRKFLEGVVICCDAAKAFAERFAELAEKIAPEKDEKRREELRKMAENCRRVPYNPPRSFYEAIQALWFNQVISYISYGGSGNIFAMGRVDQLLYPFYERDIREGRITKEEAQALIDELVVKSSYNLIPLFFLGQETASEFGADEELITIGGITRDGKDATNDLSYMILDSVSKLRGLCSNVVVRVHDNSPQDLLMKAAEVCAVTNDLKGFHNDEVIIPGLIENGYSLEDARDYALIGCVEPAGSGDSFPCTSGNDLSLVAPLEMALKNGWMRAFYSSMIGPETGDPKEFSTFDEFMEAYKKQLNHLVEFIAKCSEFKDCAYAENYHNPYISSTLEGCIEKGMDMTQGGAKYNFSSISGRGLGTIADSLAAVKKVVYDDRSMSMSELIDVLDNNFEGSEPVRQRLINKVPKFGNDDDYVDSIARDVMSTFCDLVKKQSNEVREGPVRAGAFSYGMMVSDGWFLGATPDGRRAGTPVSNSLSPSNNAETKGPTALFRSLSKLDQKRLNNGVALNVKLYPSLLQTEEGRMKFASLIRSYFSMGGEEVQFNIVDEKTLREAQEHPEEHRGLVVRVSGYNAYFVDLGKSVQDDIIARATIAI